MKRLSDFFFLFHFWIKSEWCCRMVAKLLVYPKREINLLTLMSFQWLSSIKIKRRYTEECFKCFYPNNKSHWVQNNTDFYCMDINTFFILQNLLLCSAQRKPYQLTWEWVNAKAVYIPIWFMHITCAWKKPQCKVC